MKKLFLGVVIGALITTILFCYYRPRPGPLEPTGVVYRDRIISGQMSGQKFIKKAKISQEAGEENKTFNPPSSSGRVESISETDFKTSVPVAGEIETKHVKIEFTGLTTVERKDDNLTVNTTFDPDVKETIYREPAKTWIIGLGVMADKDGLCVGGHVQKDFPIWGNLVGYGGVEVEREFKLKEAGFGIEYRF